MTHLRLFKRSFLAVTLTLASQYTSAAGFQLNAQSATGLGRAFAGDAVIADNASSLARNAATMALFDAPALSLGFETITTKIKVKDASYSTYPHTSTQDANYNNAGSTSVAPNVHFILPIDEHWAWGINAYSNFGTRTSFSSSYAANEYGGETEILSMNLGTALSYRINNQLSLGAGIDLIYGQGTLKRQGSSNLCSTMAGAPVASCDLIDVNKADGWGVGFNLGAVYELDQHNRFGLAYHYAPDITAKDGKKEAKLPLPDMVEFSGYHQIADTPFAVHYSLQYIHWKEFDQLTFKNVGIVDSKEYAWQDAWHYSLGGTYQLNKEWTLRAGYMYDTSAQDKLTSVSVPDSDRQWLSTGFTYHLDGKANIDFGFTYLMGKNVKVKEQTQPAGVPVPVSELTATTRADAIMLGLQYSRSF